MYKDGFLKLMMNAMVEDWHIVMSSNIYHVIHGLLKKQRGTVLNGVKNGLKYIKAKKNN
jgi:hypothetical protein